jgi:hypothetical protein
MVPWSDWHRKPAGNLKRRNRLNCLIQARFSPKLTKNLVGLVIRHQALRHHVPFAFWPIRTLLMLLRFFPITRQRNLSGSGESIKSFMPQGQNGLPLHGGRHPLAAAPAIIFGYVMIRGQGFGYIVKVCQNVTKPHLGFCMGFSPDGHIAQTRPSRITCVAWLL